MIKKSLKNGKYEELFFEDLFHLWKVENILPEVVLRELRALEGIEESRLIMENDEQIPIWLFGSTSPGPDTYFKISPSATKEATEFRKKNSPLKGLWHKHYYIHEIDFIKPNIKNAVSKNSLLKNAPPIFQIMSRTLESALTGQWIIFRKEGEINTYLCLAKHSDGDEKIHEKLQ